MSKNQLKKYLIELDETALRDQIIELYEKYSEVKTFYDFVFNPKEEILIAQAKAKIGKEYFPEGRRKAKKRRSTAQKLVKHYVNLGVAPELIADVMLFNIEIAQTYTAEHKINAIAFYKSMHKSFTEALKFCVFHGLTIDFENRIDTIVASVHNQHWPNVDDFDNAVAFYRL